MNAIDSDGNVRATPVVESIEMRRYVEVTSAAASQVAFEFIASRVDGTLRATEPGERDFWQFHAHDTDPFELSAEALSQMPGPDPFRRRLQRDVLRSCLTCHGVGVGIYSVQSLAQLSRERLQLPAPRVVERPR